jgi:6-phosphogluconolactonase (cycloisomerase 2 family)
MVSTVLRQHGSRAVLSALVLALSLAMLGTAGAAARGGHALVYTLTNAANGNEVVVFARERDGSLAEHHFQSGGLGTGSGLGSQGAVTLSANGRWLLAVNAGSDDVSLFRVHGSRLILTSTVPSGGDMPISITVAHGLVYVLNAGGAGNISGFRIEHGTLQPLEQSTRPLSNGGSGAGVGPAQVQFSPSGRWLVVTEKATNLIDVYRVDHNGYAGAPVVNVSHGMTPFGFAFSDRDELVVSEAFGGMPDASATTSYRINSDGTISVISGSVPTTETAACWVVISRNGQYAYVTNTGSDSVTGYAIDGEGALTLLDADGVTGMSGDTPIDAAISRDGRLLFVLNANSHSISAYVINSDGSLTHLGDGGVLPSGAVGLAAT